jgi:hypothetical protein
MENKMTPLEQRRLEKALALKARQPQYNTIWKMSEFVPPDGTVEIMGWTGNPTHALTMAKSATPYVLRLHSRGPTDKRVVSFEWKFERPSPIVPNSLTGQYIVLTIPAGAVEDNNGLVCIWTFADGSSMTSKRYSLNVTDYADPGLAGV